MNSVFSNTNNKANFGILKVWGAGRKIQGAGRNTL